MKSGCQEHIALDVGAISAERVASCILKSPRAVLQTTANFCTKQGHCAQGMKSGRQEHTTLDVRAISDERLAPCILKSSPAA